jgi:hypothetical protein
MLSFLRFINDSKYPVVTILDNDEPLATDLLQGQITSYRKVPSGTHEITVIHNQGKPFISGAVSLSGGDYFTLVIRNEDLTLINL